MRPEEAVSCIKSGDRVFIHSVAAAPHQLIRAMTNRAPELKDVEVVHIHTEGDAPYVAPEYAGSFCTNCMFVGANVREALTTGRADYIPVFLSEVPALFRQKILPIDVAMIQVSPPDKHGYCSLGVSVDVSRAAVQMAKHVVAQINPNMPRTHGDGLIHISRIDAMIEVDDPIPEVIPRPLTEVEKAIGKNIAGLVDDGATLQMGIGAIPDAVLASLTNHKNLGIHTEMFSDGLIELVEKGVVNGKKKKKHPEKIVASFVMGTNKLYRFIDDNPLVQMLDVAYVNDTAVIRRNPKVTAINSAIEVDLTGQVCADSIGTRQYSGVGGQMDFMRGASLSEGGKPIIALSSTTRKGSSRIVPYLKIGAGVVTTRAHVHYVVTEYGVANLYGKNLRQRAKALIQIAHPNHREWLEKEAFDRFKVLKQFY
ncbi:MAG TPA: acetyl-CoA hydrolase/transferase C-terminal domain-containing protein [Balneolales bacterium]|nr:acetyl-CoA hydrolase/transferase C-terminal domain-containing protein [Balneolales bacterium]